MKDVLVITLPQRNYAKEPILEFNNTVSNHLKKPILKLLFCLVLMDRLGFYFLLYLQINDYVAGYHDGALLFGKVLREKMLARRHLFSKAPIDVPLSDNPFSNITFDGKWA